MVIFYTGIKDLVQMVMIGNVFLILVGQTLWQLSLNNVGILGDLRSEIFARKLGRKYRWVRYRYR